MAFFAFGFIIASMALYVNTITIIKKVKNDQSISDNMIYGILLVGFIAYSMLVIFTD
ncbi:hypothetical protein [Maledivibacter halophilus]|uniref:Uncharacterized protein n=1 Tax=Maledivibacter halophilus TaxID=36842 RepID=A0A1T5L7K5_9FIRM|nr:hypothetical protein [Maledivibacter halophilus]SKC72007.1 hypothetical protein SAMN02194393_02548 [Maledivibacter halophilus]